MTLSVPLVLLACGQESTVPLAETMCGGVVSGELDAMFTGCRAVIYYFPDGDPIIGQREGWLFSLVASIEEGSDLEAPLEGVIASVEMPDTPATGEYSLSDTTPGVTSGTVALEDGTIYFGAEALTLSMDMLEEDDDQVIEGKRRISFVAEGTLLLSTMSDMGGVATIDVVF
jgi:hypothetical protein